jgi:hypothetical protein
LQDIDNYQILSKLFHDWQAPNDSVAGRLSVTTGTNSLFSGASSNVIRAVNRGLIQTLAAPGDATFPAMSIVLNSLVGGLATKYLPVYELGSSPLRLEIVLSSSALGSGVTGSSLTQVGTITSGTWSGSFGAVSGASLTNLTATNIVATEQTSGTMFLVGVAAGGTTGLLVNASPAGALEYNVATGELSATLIDGGSF